MTAATVTALVSLLIKGAVLLCLAELGARLLARRAAATRHLVWATALTALLALPLLAGLVPSLELPLVASPDAFGPAREVPTSLNEGAPAPGSAEPAASFDESATPIGPSDTPSRAAAPWWPAAGMILLTVWGAGALLLSLRLVAGLLTGHRLVRRSRSPDDGDWSRRAAGIAAGLGLAEAPAILVSSRVDVPMAWGLLRPRVLLPEESGEWSPEQRDLVLTHEIGHIKRGDCISHLVGQMSRALHWPNPLAWRALERLHGEREVACDELVLATGARGADYARLLLEMARGAARTERLAGTAVAMARRSQLEGRLLSILDAGRPLQSVSKSARVLVPALTLALCLPLAALQPWASADPQPVAEQEESGPKGTPDERAASSADEGAETPIDGTAIEPDLEDLRSVQRSAAAPSSDGGEEIPQDAEPAVVARVVDAVVQRLRDQDSELRADAAATLGTMESDAAVPALLVALEDPEATVRRRAAWALGMIESPAAVGGLLDRLGDEDIETRAQAAWALGMIESPEAALPLVGSLDDPSLQVARQAAWALGMIEGPEAVPGLMERLRATPADVDLAAQILWALGMIEDPAAVAGAVEHLAHESPVVRRRAAWALGMIESPDAVNGLLAALHDEAEPVRAEAAWALGMIGDARATEGLLEAMESDPDGDVQRAAMAALARIVG